MRTIDPRVALIVGAVSALRIIAAFCLPFDHDEAYYWAWAQIPAWSYVDHPPAVAWLAWLGMHLGPGPGFVRLPFIACEAAGALAAGSAAAVLARSRSAALPAALLFLLVPQATFSFGEVSPDAPYLCAWAYALLFAARLTDAPEQAWRVRVALGLALGCAVLSRAFGWALVAGIVAEAVTARRAGWRREVATMLAIVAVMVLPSVVSDAHNGWATVAFTFESRSGGEGSFVARLTTFYLGRSLAFAVLAVGLALAFGRGERGRLVRWTALPLTLVLAGLAFVDNVLPHWLLGPFASIAVGAGVTIATQPSRANRAFAGAVVVAGAIMLAGTLFLALPERFQANARVRVPLLRDSLLPDTAFADGRLAVDIAALAGSSGARVITDFPDLDAALVYAGAKPLLTGPIANRTGDVLRRRQDGSVPPFALLVDPAPFGAQIAGTTCANAYRVVRRGPVLTYRWGGAPVKAYNTLWCSDPRPDATRALFGAV